MDFRLLPTNPDDPLAIITFCVYLDQTVFMFEYFYPEASRNLRRMVFKMKDEKWQSKQWTPYHACHIALPLFDALRVHTTGIQFWIPAVSFRFASPCLITSVPRFTRPTAIRSLQGAKTRHEPVPQNCEQRYGDCVYFCMYWVRPGLRPMPASLLRCMAYKIL